MICMQIPTCHSILNRSKDYFCRPLYVYGINDVRQNEIHIAEPLVPEPSCFKFEIAVGKVKRYND
jgi:hypothetical protein